MHPTSVRRGGERAIKRGLSETVVYAAEVDYNQTVVHKTARQRYYCHLNGLAPARQENPPSRGRRDLAGETWKLNARDRSVIIRDEGSKGTIGRRSESRKKAAPLDFASGDVAGNSTVGRDQSRNLALIIPSLYYPVQTKDRLQIVAAR